MKSLMIAVFLCLFSIPGVADSITNDMFGLGIQVTTPFPDKVNDGVDLDTVRSGSRILISIKYKNNTDKLYKDFSITAFFPNRLESYTRFLSANPAATELDPDSTREANWHFPELAPSDTGNITLSLFVNTAPIDTLFFCYDIAAQAQYTSVSQLSHTNLYVPGTEGPVPYPNLWINKIDDADQVFPGDTITYKIFYGNNGTIGSIVANKVTVTDTLPPELVFLDGDLPSDIEVLADGNKILTWELARRIPHTTIDSIVFRVQTNLVTDRNKLVINKVRISSSTNEQIFVDNYDTESVWIKPDIDLGIYQDGSGQVRLFPGASQTINLVCKNLSNINLSNITISLSIADSIAASPGYSIRDIGTGTITNDSTTITWIIPQINSYDSTRRSFSIRMNNVDKYGDYSLYFSAFIDSTVALVSGIHQDRNLSNNKDSWIIMLDATPDFSVELKEVNNRSSAEPDSILNFTVTCKNLSAPALDSIMVRVWIDDGIPTTNIYHALTGSGVVTAPSLIQWKIAPLAYNDSRILDFRLAFDNIPGPDRYIALIIATIDSVETKAEELVDNSKSLMIAINAAPEIALGPITINNLALAPGATVIYTIPYASIGNFIAENAVITIEAPDYTYLLYFILHDSIYTVTDSTVKTIAIPLGDLEPGLQETIQVGVRIYDLKDLTGSSTSPLTLVLKVSLVFVGGEKNASLTSQVFFNPAATKLYLDKNIVEPGDLPIEITFIAGGHDDVEIKVYNLAGEFIKTIHKGVVETGNTYRYFWTGLNEAGNPVASGVYFIYAVSRFFNDFKKVVIIR